MGAQVHASEREELPGVEPVAPGVIEGPKAAGTSAAPEPSESFAPSAPAVLRSHTWWLVTCAVGVYQAGIMLLNTAIFPQFNGIFSQAKDWGSIFSALLALALYFVATRHPAVLAPRRALLVSCVTIVLAIPTLALALEMRNPALLVVAVCLRGVGSTWLGVMVGLSLVGLARGSGMRATLGALCVGWALSYVIELGTSMLPQAVQVGTFWLTAFATAALAYRSSQPLVERTVGAPPIVELQITSPRSFLSLSSTLFVTTVLLKMSFGFAMTFASVDDTPQATVLACVPALLVATALLGLACRPGASVRLDGFYKATMLCVLAGFLLVNPLVAEVAGLSALANVVLRAGGDLTRMLVFLLVAALGVRNPVGALPVALFMSGANSLGSVVGAQLGLAANALLASDVGVFALLLAAVTFAFVAYNVLMPDAFDLDRTVRGVEAVVEPQPAPVSVDALAQASARVAAERGLTPREAQTLELLAHGRNTQAIMERMVVSRSTAKTHVRNVYAKLGVHSQQELIDLVEAAGER